MSENTWSHRLARPLAYPLAKLGVRPNAITFLRLASGIAAAGAFAVGTRDAVVVGGFVFVLSCFFDRLDGEIARAANARSDFGERLDRASDLIVTALVFAGIGVGLASGPLGMLAVVMGIFAGAGVLLIYALRNLTRIHHGENKIDTSSANGLFDHDDALYVIGPVAWAGLEGTFLVLASVGAPLYALFVWIRYRGLRRSLAAAQAQDSHS